MKSGFGLATALVWVICMLGGCDGVSGSDKRFVAATMPSAFNAFRMYSGNGAASGRQACLAMIHTPVGDAQEAVLLERGSGMTFNVSATRNGADWDISADGAAPTANDSSAFRYLVVDCVSALEDKYLAEADDTVVRRSPLHR